VTFLSQIDIEITPFLKESRGGGWMLYKDVQSRFGDWRTGDINRK